MSGTAVPRIQPGPLDRLVGPVGRAVWGVLILAICIFILAPILVVLVASVSRTPFLTFPPSGFTLRWFTDLVELRDYFAAFRFSLLVAVLATALSLAIGLWVALVMARREFPGKAALTALFMSPIILPELALALGLLQYLSQIGAIRGMLPTLLAHSVVCAPYVIRTVQASALRLDRNLEDSALSLGARPARVLWDVTLPLLKPGLLSGGIMAFVISFDNVTISLFLSAPGATTLPALLFNQASETGLNTTLAAVCAMLTAFMLVLMLVVERLVGLERMATSAVAGKR
jgi:putative spermidine/putrescine transport system permease protein